MTNLLLNDLESNKDRNCLQFPQKDIELNSIKYVKLIVWKTLFSASFLELPLVFILLHNISDHSFPLLI